MDLCKAKTSANIARTVAEHEIKRYMYYSSLHLDIDKRIKLTKDLIMDLERLYARLKDVEKLESDDSSGLDT